MLSRYIGFGTKLSNLKLKTRSKQLLGSLLLDIMVLRAGFVEHKSDLSSTTKCYPNNICDNYKFGQN
jgi:hypothetical protein